MCAWGLLRSKPPKIEYLTPTFWYSSLYSCISFLCTLRPTIDVFFFYSLTHFHLTQSGPAHENVIFHRVHRRLCRRHMSAWQWAPVCLWDREWRFNAKGSWDTYGICWVFFSLAWLYLHIIMMFLCEDFSPFYLYLSKRRDCIVR